MITVIRIASEVEAVLWDGSDNAWDAIYNLPWDDCHLDYRTPGVMFRYGLGHTIPRGSFVYVSEPGPLEWVAQADAEVVEL